MGQLLAELRGAAEAAEVPLQVLCSLSLQYEARWAWQISQSRLDFVHCVFFECGKSGVQSLSENSEGASHE